MVYCDVVDHDAAPSSPSRTALLRSLIPVPDAPLTGRAQVGPDWMKIKPHCDVRGGQPEVSEGRWSAGRAPPGRGWIALARGGGWLSGARHPMM